MPAKQNKVILIYEDHKDPRPKMAVTSLFQNMTSCHGKGTFCVETPSKESLQTRLNNEEETFESGEKCTADLSYSPDCTHNLGKFLQQRLGRNATLRLLHQIMLNPMVRYTGVDKEYSTFLDKLAKAPPKERALINADRDKFMAKKLRKYIAKGWVMFLGGAKHFPIQCLLAKDGVDSIGYLILDSRYVAHGWVDAIHEPLKTALISCNRDVAPSYNLLIPCDDSNPQIKVRIVVLKAKYPNTVKCVEDVLNDDSAESIGEVIRSVIHLEQTLNPTYSHTAQALYEAVVSNSGVCSAETYDDQL